VRTRRIGLWIVMLAALAVLASCSRKPEPEEIVPPPGSDRPAGDSGELSGAPRTDVAVEAEPVEVGAERLEDVFFAFDKYTLDATARSALMRNAEFLIAHPDARILVEGHADERGTREYNLALGDRRARAVRDFLARYGVEAEQIQIISYGEERPFALGQGEEVWSRNRRAHFVIE